MANIYDVHAYKGGVGVTTTACALALHFCEKGNKTLLLGRDKHADALSWLGCSGNNGVTAIKQGLDHALSTTDVNIDNYEIVVVDNGQEPLATYFTNVVNVVVVRNDYISLKNTLNKEHDILVAFVADTNALSAQDVAYTLGSTPVVAKIDPSVARAIDAGLAISRNHLFPWTEKIAGFVRV